MGFKDKIKDKLNALKQKKADKKAEAAVKLLGGLVDEQKRVSDDAERLAKKLHVGLKQTRERLTDFDNELEDGAATAVAEVVQKSVGFLKADADELLALARKNDKLVKQITEEANKI